MTPQDEAKRRQELERANAARRLMENPLWDEAWDVLHTNTLKQWQASREDQTALREDAYKTIRIAQVVRKYIERHIETGKAAEIQLNEARNG